MRKLILVFLPILLCLPMLATAQDACPPTRLVINDGNLGQTLDRARICEAAQSLIDNGLIVYVFGTSEAPANEDAWFLIRDRFEIDETGIYDPAGDGSFVKNAFAIEFTTNTTYLFGFDIAFGESLFGTPLDADDAVNHVEMSLRDAVAGRDYTAAVVSTLGLVTEIAYPVPVVQPTVAATLVPTTVPATAVQEQQIATEVIPQEAPQENEIQSEPLAQEVDAQTQPESGGISFIAILVGAFGLLVIVGIPVGVYAALLPTKRLREYHQNLSKVTRAILVDLEKLVNSGILESRISSSDINEDPEIASEVMSDFQKAQAGTNRMFEAMRIVMDMESGYSRGDWWSKEKLEHVIREWEIIYLTLVGRTESIQNLSEEDTRVFFNPIEGIPKEDDLNEFEMQVQHIFEREEGENPMWVDTIFVDRETANSEGILGTLFNVKKTLEEVSEARDSVGAEFAQAKADFSTWKSGIVIAADAISLDTLTSYATQLIAEIEEAITNHRWLSARDMIHELAQVQLVTIEALREIEDAVLRIDTVTHELSTEPNYTFSEPRTVLATAQPLRSQIEAAFKIGDFDKVGELTDSITAIVQEVRKLYRAEVTLHLQNVELISKLVKRINSVAALEKDAKQAREQLTAYPASNLDGLMPIDTLVADFKAVDEQVEELQALNALTTEGQQFATVSSRLDVAFGKVSEIEDDLQEYPARVTLLTQLSQTLSTLLLELDRDIAIVRELFDSREDWIDDTLEQQLDSAWQNVQEGSRLFDNNELYAADAALQKANTEIDEIYEKAQGQVEKAENLFAEVQTQRTTLQSKIRSLKLSFKALPDPAKKAATRAELSELESQATDAIAQQATNLVDAELREHLRSLVISLKALIDKANSLSRTIKSDGREYDDLVKSAREAISTARTTIKSANGYVTSTDAYSSGLTNLDLARRTLPSLSDGILTVALLNQVIQSATSANTYALNAQKEAQARIQQEEEERAERRRRERLQRQSTYSSPSWSSTSDDDDDDNDIFGISSSPSVFGSSSPLSNNSVFGNSSHRTRNSITGSSRRVRTSTNMGSSRRR